MKKFVIFFILFMVLLFSADVFSASLYDGLIQTSDINYKQGEGKVEYILVPIQYISNYKVDGFEQKLNIDYAVADNILLTGSFEGFNEFDTGAGFYKTSIKYKVLEKDSYSMALEADYTNLKVDNNDFTFLKNSGLLFSLLTDYKLNDNLTLHNNLELGFFEAGDEKRKELTAGLSYNIDKYSEFRLLFEGQTDNQLSNLDYLLKLAYQKSFSDKYLYTAACNYNFDSSDFSLENQINYFYSDDLRFEARYTIQSDDASDGLQLNFEKDIDEKLSIIGEYQREFAEIAISAIKSGFVYRF